MKQISYNKGGQQTEITPNGLGMIWFKYFPYWPLFLLLLVLTTGGAWWMLRGRVPLYEAKAAILIKDEKKGLDDSKMIESMNQLSTKKIIENEIEVIHSRALMGDVVKTLHLYAPVFENGNAKKPSSAYSTSPVIIEAKSPDSVHAEKVFFSYDKAKSQVVINGQGYALNTWVTTKYGVLKFIPQAAVTGTPIEPLYFSLISPKAVTENLSDRLEVLPASKQSTVINLSLKDENAKRSEDILNGLLLAYGRASIQDKNNLASNTLEFLDERLKVVTEDLNAIESKMQQYKSNRGAVDISSQGQLFLQNVSTNDQKLGDVDVQLAVLDKVENYVKSNNNAAGITPSTLGVNDTRLAQLLDQLYQQELNYAKLSQTTGLNNPMMVSVNDQINKIKPSILENIASQKQNLMASRNNITTTNNRYSSILQAMPEKERDLVEISREQNIKSGIYNYLLQKREETALSNRSVVSDSRVIDKAEAFGPVNTDKKKPYIAAFILAIALGVGIISLKELINRTIMFRHDIESRTSSPIIGEILHEKSKESLVLGDGQRTFIAEQFRKLRTSLAYIGIHGDRKKLLVTSTVPGDGKSFIVANLGISLAMAGKKVIVLEFDLSDPTLSDKLGVIVNKGLSDYLMGKVEIDEIIHQTEVNENLYIIPSGPLPDNPSDLIVSDRVQELMTYLTPMFDYVIVDTAPVGLLSDAYVLSSYCDGTLYVIRHRHTPKIAIDRIDENNEINELKNMGIVFNDVRSRGFSKNGYGYGYGYGYIHKEKRGKKKSKRNVA